MGERRIEKGSEAIDEDWYGNNAAFTCPLCSKVFIVSALLREPGKPKGQRECPRCHKTTAYVGKTSATILWPTVNQASKNEPLDDESS